MTKPNKFRGPTLAQLIWHFGPGWVAFRTCYALRLKLGCMRLRMPSRSWDRQPLSRFLGRHCPADPDAYARWRQDNSPRFFFRPEDRALFRSWFSRWDPAEGGPIADATRIAAGEFPFFSRTWLAAGMPPDWHANPLTGDKAPSNRHWSRIREFAHGDIKFLWELSRFGWAYTLVRAYWRDGDARWPELFWELTESWRELNPPQRGVQWRCGQEISFRLMAWCFALYGFADAAASTPARRAMLTQMIAVSARRIAANFRYALSQRNNHGISEALGLWTVGTLFPELRSARRWEKRGRKWLERLGLELIYEDGSFAQHSTNYHRLMLHDYLWALRLAELNGHRFSPALEDRVKAAADFLHGLVDGPSGQTPNFGSNDGALILPLSSCDYRDYRPAVQAAAMATRGVRRFPEGPWDEESLWLLGPDALSRPLEPGPTPSLTADDGGCYTIRDRESWVFIHCPQYRHRPGQADLLHLDLWWRGSNVALDPGSYSYNAPPPWDHGLARTRHHNTVTVDEMDQMERAGRFLWMPWARGRTLRHEWVAGRGRWAGEHDGYQRLNDPVQHHREVLQVGQDAWCVVDDLLAQESSHRFELGWLLADAPYRWIEPDRALELDLPGGRYCVTVGVWPRLSAISMVRADPDSDRGWHSPAYGVREPALSLRAVGTAKRFRFVTLFGPEPGRIVLEDEMMRVILPPADFFLEWNLE